MMSEILVSGAKRPSACGGLDWLPESVRVIVAGSFMLSEAVWKVEPCWFLISTPPITAACNTSASAPRLADHASVRGERLAKKPETLVDRRDQADGCCAGSASIAANSLFMARTEGAPSVSFRLMVSAY